MRRTIGQRMVSEGEREGERVVSEGRESGERDGRERERERGEREIKIFN